jgi:multiple sugar transport system substrate-binding protein
MNKKMLSGMITTLALATVVSACGNNTNNGGSASPESSPAGNETKAPVEVTLAGWGSSPEEQALLQQVLDEFETKNPDVKVKYEVIADQYMDVIKTRLIGNEAPDVFYLDAFEAPALIELDVLEPLDGYVTPEFDIEDFEGPTVNAFKSPEGSIYGFPKDTSTLALFYNKKMFADAGIAAPPATWDELLAVSEKLTKKDGDKVEVYGLGQAPELARQMFMIKAFGGKLTDEDGMAAFATPEAEKGLALVIDQHTKANTAGQPSDVGAGWGGEMFGQQKAAMVIEGNWAIPFLQNNFSDVDFGTAELPTVNGNKGTMAFTVAYVMNKNSEKKEAAWKLISYLTGKEGMKTWTSKGFALPTRKSVAAELGYDKDPLRGALVAGSSYATAWQAGSTLPTISNNFNNTFVAAYTGMSTLTEALKQAQETANKEIKAAR